MYKFIATFILGVSDLFCSSRMESFHWLVRAHLPSAYSAYVGGAKHEKGG